MNVSEYLDLIRNTYGESFKKFKDLLLYNNDKFNLTAICDENGIYIKHFLDSVMGEKYFERGDTVAEIGSGGGFPSIPLKIIRDDLSFTLIESTAKKCIYLKDVVDKLRLKDTKVINGRAEELARQGEHREKYGVAVARAVARLNTLSEYCMPFIKIGGRFIAYKGDCEDELKEGEKAIKTLGGEIENVEKYELPGGDKRTLVVVKKIKSTPEKYPRGQGKERKNPII